MQRIDKNLVAVYLYLNSNANTSPPYPPYYIFHKQHITEDS